MIAKIRILFDRIWFKILLNKNHLIVINDSHRGIGKTTMLIKRSMKHNAPIVVGNQNHWNLIKDIEINTQVYRLAENFTIDFKGKSFPNGVLIDESIDKKMIDWIKDNNIEIRGGFVYGGKNEK